MVSALVRDTNLYYVSMPTGQYRVWLRAWSFEDDNSFTSPWSSGGGVEFAIP